ncbi:MAG: SRPBCC domain-containing protein [Pseudolabrys sp.]
MQVTATPQPSKDFVISREFNAPRHLLWQCFTDPERMTQWWGPKGVKIIKSKMDLRVGGTYLYGMQPPDGKIMWGRMVYRKIDPPARLEFINSFSDEAGGLTRHPMAPGWPLEMFSVFSFEELGPTKTKFTVRWAPHNPTDEEQKAFDAGHDSMTMGWSGTLDKLENYVKGAA